MDELWIEGDVPQEKEIIDLEDSFEVAELSEVPIRQFQVWSRTDQETGTTEVIEIAGFHDERTVAIYPWEVVKYGAQGPEELLLDIHGANIRGAGTMRTVDLGLFFDRQAVFQLLILDAERHTK